MADQPSQKNFTDYFKTVQFWVIAILGPSGLIATVVGFVRLIQGNSKLATVVLLVIGIALSYAILIYVIRAKGSRAHAIILVRHDEVDKDFKYSSRIRKAALLLITLVTVILIASAGTFFYYQYTAPRTMVILVADFDGPDPKNYRVTETIIEQLRKNTEGYSDITVRGLGHQIDPREGSIAARKEGKDQRAAVILWGWYGRTNDKVIVSVNFEILEQPELLSLHSAKQISFFPAAQLESFVLQTELSSKTSYVVLAAVGVARFEAKDFAGAISRLSVALNQQDFTEAVISPAELYYLRARAYLLMTPSDLNNVISDCTKAVEFKETFPDAYLVRGLAYAQKGMYAAATSEFDLAIKFKSDFALAYLLRGLMSEVMMEPKRAAIDYDLTTKVTPHDGSDALAIALGFWRSGKAQKAIETISEALKTYPEGSTAYLSMRALIYAEQREFDAALADVNEVISAEPNRTEGIFLRANVLLAKGDISAAIKDCRSVLKVDPYEASAYFTLGQAHDAEYEFDKAIQDYTILIQLQPEGIIGYVGRAGSYLNKNSFDESIADYTSALKLMPDFADLHVLRGFVYFKKKDIPNAIADYDKAVALKTDVADAYLYRGQAYLDQKRFSDAIDDFNRAIKLKPDDSAAYLGRGTAYLHQENYDKCILDFEYIVRRYPEEAIGYTLRSVALMAKAIHIENPDTKKELLAKAEIDLEQSKKLLNSHQFDIDERNRISRTLSLR